MEHATEHRNPAERDGRPGTKAAGSNKVSRIAAQSRGLFDDIKGWIELRIRLARLELRQELESRRQDAVMGTAIAVIAVLALVFVLIAAALGLGAWMGHPAWGFLTVTGLLLVIALVLYYAHFGRKARRRRKGESKALDQGEPRQLPSASRPALDAHKKVEDTRHER